MKKKLLPISKLTRPFLLKFFADPKKKWCSQAIQTTNGERCAIGHVAFAVTGDAYKYNADMKGRLSKAFGLKEPSWGAITDINNGIDPDFKQRTPRARILAALRAAAKKGAK